MHCGPMSNEFKTHVWNTQPENVICIQLFYIYEQVCVVLHKSNTIYEEIEKEAA